MSVEATAAVWAMTDLTSTEKLVLVRIADHADPEGRNAWPSLSRLKRDTGLAESTVRGAMRRLERKGALLTELAKGPKGTNRYRVVLRRGQEMAPSGDGPPQEMAPTPPDAGPPPPQEMAPNRPKNRPEPSSARARSLPASKVGTDEDSEFCAFWERYPRKVGKGDARRAWRAARKRGVEPERIIAAAQRYAAAVAASESRFVKHPGPWLTDERYDDEPPARAAEYS